jgi:uroporphyrinogen decarboxylase
MAANLKKQAVSFFLKILEISKIFKGLEELQRTLMSTTYSNRERILATLAGEILDYVPSWTQGFFNAATVHRLLPAAHVIENFTRFSADIPYDFRPQSLVQLDKLIAFNHHIDRAVVGIGWEPNVFGHGGPGEFNGWVIEKGAGRQIVEYETGAKAQFNDDPHFFHLFDMPVRTIDDLEAVQLPDPETPSRWEGFRHDVAHLKHKGEFTVGYLNGFFSGCHYFFMDYQDLILNLALDLELVEAVVEKLGNWNLKAAQMMCEAGVDCISLADDLGSDKALLFSPDLYDQLFFPWHRALCDLAHAYGVRVHLHSHGNIMKLLDRLVETGIDMLNPLDQTEGMDLAIVKERYGDRLTLVGGMDKFIFEQDLPEIERRLRRSVEIGRSGGRYILMDTGGIPDTISRERFDAFLEISRRVRGQVPS